MKKMMDLRALGMVVVAAAAMQLTGCASVKLPASSATVANVDKLKAMGSTAPMATGEFKAEGKALEVDKGVSVRGANTLSPAEGSFALQLRDQLTTDLKAAGLHASDAKVVISGVLTVNELAADISTGTGRLGARFTVVREGKPVFNKEVIASSTWESSFIGAVAIPAAFNQYGALYQKLVGQLIDDAEFRAAIR